MVRVVSMLLLSMIAAACGSGVTTDATSGPTETSDAGPTVVVTTTVLGSLVADVVGDDGVVEVLMPVGADPHGFAPSAAQTTLAEQADLIVANGLGLEEGLVPLLEAAETDGVPVLHATDHVDLLEGGAHEHAHDDEGEHADDEAHDDEAHEDEAHDDETEHADDEDGDPHIWLDPVRMADVALAIGEALAAVDDSADWEARAEALSDELTDLDTELRETLEVVPDDRRVLVTNHDVLGYLADRYDLRVVATLIPGGSTLAEPSAADLEDVVQAVRDTGVPAIIAETSSASRLAEVVAEEVGADVQIVELYTESLSDVDGPAVTYQDLMRTNVQRIADALAG